LAGDGLHLRRGRGPREVRLAWADHEAAQLWVGEGLTYRALPDTDVWDVRPVYPHGFAPRVYVRNARESASNPKKSYVLDDRYLVDLAGSRLLAVLCDFVATTPVARPALDDSTRTTALLAQLASGHLHDAARHFWGPWWSSQRYDLFLAVFRVLQRRVHTIGGRQIDTDPPIDIDAAVQDATDLLFQVPHLDPTLRDPGTVRAEIERQLTRAQPWPFGILLPSGTAGSVEQ